MSNELKIKQSLLDKISKQKKTTVTELCVSLDLSINIIFSYCEEIFFDGYIDFTDSSTKSGKNARVSINGKGELFTENGGYTKEIEEADKNNKYIRQQSYLKNLSLLVSIITGIAAISFGILNYSKNSRIDALENELNQTSHSEIKDLLVGKWVNSLKNGPGTYIFYRDNTWEYITFHSNQKKIYRGEYQLGVNMGVFLRRFGSQHFGHDTTYVDVKSGIGASFLYLENNQLINNQEDYEIRYKKVEM